MSVISNVKIIQNGVEQTYEISDAAARTGLAVLEPTAVASDVGKALVAKAVSDGKVTAYEFGDSGSVDPADVSQAVSDWCAANITEDPTVVIDSSLSTAGAAADAKATGTKITNLGSALYFEYTDTSLFESGGISSFGGNNSSSSTRIRTTTYLRPGIKKIRAANDYKYIIAAYNSSGTYIGMWSGSAWAKTAKWHTGETQLSQISSYQYRIVLAKSNDATIAKADASNLTLCATTDTGLSLKGFPADAEATGAECANIRAEVQDLKIASGKEIHLNKKEWAYYGTGIFSGSSIIPAAAYDIYYAVADANFNLWTDSDLSDSEDVYLRIYSGLPFDSTTYVRGGTYLRNDQGTVTTDTMPKEASKFAIETGQYIVVSVAGSSSYLRFLADGGSLAKNYVYSNVVLSSAQIEQVDDSQMRPLIKKTATRVDMYVPTSNKKYYLNYCFVYTHHGIEGEVTDNSDGWRMSYLYLRKPDLSSVAYIVYNGEWEMAIRLDGRSDYIGLGNHGDEIQSLFKLYVDGEEITENGTFDLREFHKAQLIQKLTMYDPLDHETIVGYHTRIDTIDADRRTVTIENRVEFVTSQTIRAGYLFMCPISRSHDSVQITDTFIDNRDYVLTDCSSMEFDPSDANNGVGKTKQGVTEYQFWGAGLDLHGYARVLRRVAPDAYVPNSHISNDASYNKIYFGMCSNGDTVENGTVWLMETEFYLDSGNNH